MHNKPQTHHQNLSTTCVQHVRVLRAHGAQFQPVRHSRGEVLTTWAQVPPLIRSEHTAKPHSNTQLVLGIHRRYMSGYPHCAQGLYRQQLNQKGEI